MAVYGYQAGKFNKENKPFYMVDHEDGIYMNYIEMVEQI